MGATAARPVREAPVRFVAKKRPKLNKTPIEEQFKKPAFSKQGINTRQDDVNTEPIMYVETSKDASSTELTDNAPPRWYINTYLEIADNIRQDQTVITGNLPMSWERDKYEPYSLVRGRIDDEDLDWVLAAEQRKMPVDELVQYTKLDRNTLQDILDTVELPRTQYRNYKGKLHKSIENANTHMEARNAQMEKAREMEILRQIGYSDNEMEQEAQYITNRSRGMKTLDDIGASRREQKRQARAAETNEMEEMLAQRRLEQIERGEYQLSEEDITSKPERLAVKPKYYEPRTNVLKNMYAADAGGDKFNQVRFHWWLDRSRRIKRAVDKIHGVPLYNERLSANEDQARRQMQEAAEFNFKLGQAQGSKGYSDPRSNADQLMHIMRTNKAMGTNPTSVEVHEDGVTEESDIFRYPHTRSHPERPTEELIRDHHDHAEPVDTDIHRLHGYEAAGGPTPSSSPPSSSSAATTTGPAAATDGEGSAGAATASSDARTHTPNRARSDLPRGRGGGTPPRSGEPGNK